ncbi:hypothetical protein MASR1M60_14620 [Rhodocyclaceae bacterium]
MSFTEPTSDAYHAIFENNHTVMLIIDPADGRIVDANARAAAFYGWPHETLTTMSITDINMLPPEQVKQEMALACSEKRAYFNFRHQLANGKVRDVEVYSGPIKLGERTLLYSVVRDVTQRLEMERTLSFLARRATYLLELPQLADTLEEDAFIQRGLQMAEDLLQSPLSFIHFVNDAAEMIEPDCWAEALRQRLPAVRNDTANATSKGELTAGDVALQRLVSVPVIEQGDVVMLLGVGNKPGDYVQHEVETLQLVANELWRLVQRSRSLRLLADNLAHQRELNKRLEAMQGQLLQSEKMASIGQLAAGVAHELNNPIGFVSSNLGTLESYVQDLFTILDAYAAVDTAALPPCPELVQAQKLKRNKDYDFLCTDLVQLLAESRDGLSRVAKIIRDLKDFSRAGEVVMQWANLHQGLESTLNVVWNELKYKCTVKKEFGELPDIWCEPSQLNQVFMNLLVNAGHAITEQGEITIRTGRTDKEVFVAISDTGSGIAPEHLNSIFDPFFTTKPVGKGTGLGLSLSYGIVQKHGGRIEVESTLGQGSTFTVWLPVEPPELPPEQPASAT